MIIQQLAKLLLKIGSNYLIEFGQPDILLLQIMWHDDPKAEKEQPRNSLKYSIFFTGWGKKEQSKEK